MLDRLAAIAVISLSVTRAAAAAEPDPVRSALEPGSLGLGHVGVRAGLFANLDFPVGLGFEGVVGLGRIDLAAGGGTSLGNCKPLESGSCFLPSVAVQGLLADSGGGRQRLGLRLAALWDSAGAFKDDVVFSAVLRAGFATGIPRLRLIADADFGLGWNGGPAEELGGAALGVEYSGARIGVYLSGGAAIDDRGRPGPLFSAGVLIQ